MLSCKDITDKASDYLDKELPLTTRIGVHMHLFICVSCRRYMKQFQTTISTLNLMKKHEPVSEETTHKLVDCFKNEIKSSHKPDNNNK